MLFSVFPWAGSVSKVHSFDNVLMLLAGFLFYCVVKCKRTSLYDSACCEAELSSPSIKILAFLEDACHAYQSLELFCCIIPSFLAKAVAVAKVFVRFSVNNRCFFKNQLCVFPF